MEIFDTPNNIIEKYYWDERVGADGSTLTGTLESIPPIYFEDSSTTSGSECQYCGTDGSPGAKARADDCGSNYHQVRIDCDRSSTNCGWHKWRNAWSADIFIELKMFGLRGI